MQTTLQDIKSVQDCAQVQQMPQKDTDTEVYFHSQYSEIDYEQIKLKSVKQSIQEYNKIKIQKGKSLEKETFLLCQKILATKHKINQAIQQQSCIEKCQRYKKNIEQSYFMNNHQEDITDNIQNIQSIKNCYSALSQFVYNCMQTEYIITIQISIKFQEQYQNYRIALDFQEQEIIKAARQKYLKQKESFIEIQINQIKIFQQKEKIQTQILDCLKKIKNFYIIQKQKLKICPTISLFYLSLNIQWENFNDLTQISAYDKRSPWKKFFQKQMGCKTSIQKLMSYNAIFEAMINKLAIYMINIKLSQQVRKVTKFILKKSKISYIDKKFLNLRDAKICLCLNICKIYKKIAQKLQSQKQKYGPIFNEDSILNEIQNTIADQQTEQQNRMGVMFQIRKQSNQAQRLTSVNFIINQKAKPGQKFKNQINLHHQKIFYIEKSNATQQILNIINKATSKKFINSQYRKESKFDIIEEIIKLQKMKDKQKGLSLKFDFEIQNNIYNQDAQPKKSILYVQQFLSSALKSMISKQDRFKQKSKQVYGNFFKKQLYQARSKLLQKQIIKLDYKIPDSIYEYNTRSFSEIISFSLKNWLNFTLKEIQVLKNTFTKNLQSGSLILNATKISQATVFLYFWNSNQFSTYQNLLKEISTKKQNKLKIIFSITQKHERNSNFQKITTWELLINDQFMIKLIVVLFSKEIIQNSPQEQRQNLVQKAKKQVRWKTFLSDLLQDTTSLLITSTKTLLKLNQFIENILHKTLQQQNIKIFPDSLFDRKQKVEKDSQMVQYLSLQFLKVYQQNKFCHSLDILNQKQRSTNLNQFISSLNDRQITQNFQNYSFDS